MLPQAHNEDTPSKLRFRFGKDFHVSPYLPMDMNYDWRFSLPDGRLLVHMESWREGAMQAYPGLRGPYCPAELYDDVMRFHAESRRSR